MLIEPAGVEGEPADAPPRISPVASADVSPTKSPQSPKASEESQALKYREPWCCNCNSWVLENQDHYLLKRWDGLCGVVVLYIAFATPFEVAFLDAELGPLFYFNRMIDGMFTCDMVLQFFLPYLEITRNGEMYIHSPRMIARRYLGRWFAIDLTSILPFDILSVTVLAGDDSVSQLKILRTIRLMRLFKLVRLLKGMRIFYRYQTQVGLSYRKTTLFTLFFAVVIAGHWLGCVLGLMSRLQGDCCVLEDADQNTSTCVHTWATDALRSARVDVGEDGQASAFYFYLVALHFGMTILVHPHSSSPTSTLELMSFVICVLIGGFIWTRLIGKSTVMFTSLDRHNIFYQQMMDDLNCQVAQMNMDPVLRMRLREFFMHTQDMSQKQTWDGILKRMSPQLKREVAREANKRWVRSVPFLSRLSWDMITEVCMKLDKALYCREETFGEDYQLYIMNVGSVKRATRNGRGWRICGSGRGAVWGEEHLLLTNPELLQDNAAQAMTFVEVLSLKAEDFAKIAVDFPECQRKLRKYFVRCAMTFGLFFSADKILIMHGEAPRFMMKGDGFNQRSTNSSRRKLRAEKRRVALLASGAASIGAPQEAAPADAAAYDIVVLSPLETEKADSTTSPASPKAGAAADIPMQNVRSGRREGLHITTGFSQDSEAHGSARSAAAAPVHTEHSLLSEDLQNLDDAAALAAGSAMPVAKRKAAKKITASVRSTGKSVTPAGIRPPGMRAGSPEAAFQARHRDGLTNSESMAAVNQVGFADNFRPPAQVAVGRHKTRLDSREMNTFLVDGGRGSEFLTGITGLGESDVQMGARPSPTEHQTWPKIFQGEVMEMSAALKEQGRKVDVELGLLRTEGRRHREGVTVQMAALLDLLSTGSRLDGFGSGLGGRGEMRSAGYQDDDRVLVPDVSQEDDRGFPTDSRHHNGGRKANGQVAKAVPREKDRQRKGHKKRNLD